jgi:hypothetical protein
VLIWFVATSVATVWFVFRDPRFDYRPLIVGALLPDAIDVWFGGARALHSVVVAMAALVVVMLATIGRRRARRILLGVPIGILLHLVFDGAFSDPDVFWWPVSGSFGDASLPVVERGWWSFALEGAGVALVALGWRRLGLADPERRKIFFRTGCLELPAAGYR